MDALAEIKRLYYAASKTTITDDFARAIDLLKSMASEQERERAAVFMDGLTQMRSQWRPSAEFGARSAESGAKSGVRSAVRSTESGAQSGVRGAPGARHEQRSAAAARPKRRT